MSLFNELKRRNVFRVGAAYMVVAWLLVQVVGELGSIFALPDVISQSIVIMLAIGFPIALLVSWIYEVTPEGITTQEAVDAGAISTKGRKLNGVIIGGMALAIVFLVVDNYVLEEDSPSPSTVALEDTDQSDFEITATAELEKSIAVLPFANLSSDPEQEYFSDGLSEEILNKLARVGDLQVAARTSSFYFKDRNEDMRSIGEQLGVNFLLEGSVRKAGNDLRVTAQLIQAENGFHLWSDTFDGSLEDIFNVQDEIAQAVTTALSVSLGAGEFDRPGMTRNVEAYDAYLYGWSSLNDTGITAINTSIESLQRAVEIDPEFGLGWLGLGDAYGFGRILLPTDQLQEILNSQEQAYQQARLVTPEMPQLLLTEAGQNMNQGNWLETESILLQLLEQNDGLEAEVNRSYGTFLRWVGRGEEALPYLQRAKRLNPMAPGIAMQLTNIYLILGRSEEVMAEADRGISFNAAALNPFLLAQKALAAYMDGDRELAAEFIRAGGAPPGEIYIEAADFLAVGEDEAALEAIRANLENNMSPLATVALSPPATVAGDIEFATDLLLGPGGQGGPATFGIIPVWTSLNSEIRKTDKFKELVVRTGLLDYWRTTGNWADLCQPVGESDFECF